jgi:hypothetical protein
MPFLWISKNGGNWSEFSLDGMNRDQLELTTDIERMRLQRCGEGWVVLFSPEILASANGLPCELRLLADRDEIVCWPIAERESHFRMIYSAERLATIRPFQRAQGAGVVFCARCRQPVAEGEPAVVCPRCGAPYHSSADWPCWTHGPQCNCCNQSTAPATDLSWTPEDL